MYLRCTSAVNLDIAVGVDAVVVFVVDTVRFVVVVVVVVVGFGDVHRCVVGHIGVDVVLLLLYMMLCLLLMLSLVLVLLV